MLQGHSVIWKEQQVKMIVKSVSVASIMTCRAKRIAQNNVRVDITVRWGLLNLILKMTSQGIFVKKDSTVRWVVSPRCRANLEPITPPWGLGCACRVKPVRFALILR